MAKQKQKSKVCRNKPIGALRWVGVYCRGLDDLPASLKWETTECNRERAAFSVRQFLDCMSIQNGEETAKIGFVFAANSIVKEFPTYSDVWSKVGTDGRLVATRRHKKPDSDPNYSNSNYSECFIGADQKPIAVVVSDAWFASYAYATTAAKEANIPLIQLNKVWDFLRENIRKTAMSL